MSNKTGAEDRKYTLSALQNLSEIIFSSLSAIYFLTLNVSELRDFLGQKCYVLWKTSLKMFLFQEFLINCWHFEMPLLVERKISPPSFGFVSQTV